MKINVFEGARRIVMLIQAAFVIGCVVSYYEDATDAPNVRYATYGPLFPFVKMEDNEACESENAQAWKDANLSDGTEVKVVLCFKAMEFDNGEQLIPYKVDDPKKGFVWGGREYSTEVTSYTERRAKVFRIPQGDEAVIRKQIRSGYWSTLEDAITTIFLGYIGIALFSYTVGWVVRGFAGIPQGQDRRKESANVSE